MLQAELVAAHWGIYGSVRHFATRCLLLITLLLAAMGGVCASAEEGTAVFDLRRIQFDARTVVPLRGQCEFYWRQFVNPLDFSRSTYHRPTLMPMPSSWTDYRIEGEPLSASGYATYRFFIVKPTDRRYVSYALRIPTIYSNYKLWVNGELYNETGRVANTPFSAKSAASIKILPIHPSAGRPLSDTLEVVLQVSNFDYPSAGIRHAISFGYLEALLNQENNSTRIGFLALGILLLLILLYSIMMHIAGQGRQGLWIILCGLLFSLHVSTLNGNMLIELLQSIPWSTFHTIRYFTVTTAGLTGFLFVRQSFPREVKPWLSIPLIALGIVLSIYVAISSPRLYAYSKPLITGYLALVLVATCALILPKAIRHRAPLAIPLLLGLLAVGICFAVDSLYYARGSESALPFTQIGVVVLILLLSLPTGHRLANIIRRQGSIRSAHEQELEEVREERSKTQARNRELSSTLRQLKAQLEVQRWADHGYSLLAHSVAQAPRELHPLSQQLLTVYCQYAEVHVAALYVARYNAETMQAELILTAHVGLTAAMRERQGVVLEREGLVGACYAENMPQHIANLPESFLEISTGLGGSTPPAILVLPLQADAGVIGVLALGRLTDFAKHEIAFAQRSSLIIANALMQARNAETNVQTLREALQAKEALAQEKELMQDRLLQLEAELEEARGHV